MDTTLIGAIIGAIVSIVCASFGWYLASFENRKRDRRRNSALGSALLLESHAAAWHILNTQEFLRRCLEKDLVPSLSTVEMYLPTPMNMYATAGHRIADLGADSAQTLVEFHTHLERVLARTRRVCSLDGRRIRKDARLSALKDCRSDWGYAAWACGECNKALFDITSESLSEEQVESVMSYITHLGNARSGEFKWSLPYDLVGLDQDERIKQIEIDFTDLPIS